MLPAHEFNKEFAAKYPYASIKNVFAKMVELRVIKSD